MGNRFGLRLTFLAACHDLIGAAWGPEPPSAIMASEISNCVQSGSHHRRRALGEDGAIMMDSGEQKLNIVNPNNRQHKESELYPS